MTATEREYLLGTNEAELRRLGVQHTLWSAQAYALWESAGFQLGQTILDVGCGPGFASLDLAQLVGPAGRVIAVDVSERFVSHLRAQQAACAVTNLDVRLGDVQSLDLPPGSVDAAYSRWVLCFVADPEAVVAAVARALRPGGTFAVQDYYNYGALRLAPRSAVFERVIAAVERSWRESGGDSEVGCRLPAIFARHGLRPRVVRPQVRIARSGEPLWQWPTTFFRNYVPALVERGYLTAADRTEFDADWAARTADRDAFLLTPPMIDLVGVKE